MIKIIGFGNALVDVLVQIEDETMLNQLLLFKGGMHLIGAEQQSRVQILIQDYHQSISTGGCAGNVVLALAALGASPGFIGKVGADEKGEFFQSNCSLKGIDARLIVEPGHATGVAHTLITPDGERTFATYLGAAAMLNAEELDAGMLAGYGILHLEGYLVQDHALILKIAQMAKQAGMLLSIDLASYNVVRDDLAFLRSLVERYVDIVFANEEESSAFTQGKEPTDALREIASMCSLAVVKLGAKGSMAMRDRELVKIPGSHVDVVDTTAAGDFFAGGFLYAMTHDASLQQCLRAGACLSEQVIQVVGTMLPETCWQKIREQVNEILKG